MMNVRVEGVIIIAEDLDLHSASEDEKLEAFQEDDGPEFESEQSGDDVAPESDIQQSLAGFLPREETRSNEKQTTEPMNDSATGQTLSLS